MKLSDISIHAWLQEYDIRNERGERIDFRDHLFLFDIYSDFSPNLVAYKAAQVGFTTMAILKKFFVAAKLGLDIIYTMPTQADSYTMVGSKVNRIIDANQILQEYTKDRDTMEQKRVGNHVIYYRGTSNEKDAISITSDWNIHDEEDRSNQPVIQTYSSRTQHSKYRWNHHFSNPSVEGAGVSRYWPESDQKHWFIRCGGCTKEQFLMWPDNIDIAKRAYICKYCKKVLTDEERRVGRWIQKFKDKAFSGYWLNLMMTPWTSAGQIIDLFNTKSKEYFWNFVLGLPYVGEGNKVTPDIIYRNLTARINTQEAVVIGCDSGLVKHYTLGNSQGLFFHGKTESWSTIDSLLKQYDRSIAVIDALPDLTGPRELQEKWPGRVFLCHYAKDRKTQQLIRWGKNEEYGTVLVDRNRTIQLVIDEFGSRRIPLQGTRDDWAPYYDHWDTLYRVSVEDRITHSPTYEWMTSTGMDHWVHATVYWRVGMDMMGAGPTAEILSSETTIPAPVGPPISHQQTIRPVTQDGRDPVEATLEQLKHDDEPDDWREA